MKGPVLCIILMMLTVLSYGQTCSIKINGTILDEHSNEAVANAKIFLKNSTIKTSSDSLGHFLLEGVCVGEIQLICLHHIGCEPVRIDLNLQRDTSFIIRTEMHFMELEEFELVRFKLDRDVLSEVSMNKLEKFNSAGNTLGRQLETLPGVSSLSTGGSIAKPVIHGLHSNRVILLNNGIRQEGQQWGSEHAPEVDPFLSTDISIVKGASALRYGPEAIGGVVKINPPKWRKSPGWSGNAFIGASSNGRKGMSAFVLENTSRKITGLSLRGHFSAQKAGNISAPNYVMGNTGVEEFNFSMAGQYIKGKHEFNAFYSRFNTQLGVFAGAHIGNLSDLEAAIASDEPVVKAKFTYNISLPKQIIVHDLVKASWRVKWSEKFSSDFVYGYQNNDRSEFDTHNSFSSPSDTALPDFRLELYTHSLDIKFNKIVGSNWKFEYGVQSIRQGNERAGRYLVPNFHKTQAGAFGLLQFQKLKWAGEGGVRYDFVQLNTFLYENKVLITPEHFFQNISSSFGLSRTIGHHLVLKGTVGNAWRPPSISELYSDGLHHGAAAIERGDRSIGLEKSFQGNLTAAYNSKRLKAQIDLYHIHFSNFIYLNPQNELELTIKGAFPSFQYEEVAARFSGVDLTVDFSILKKLNWRTKYSVVRAYNLSQKTFLVGIPSDVWHNELIYSRTDKKSRTLLLQVEGVYSFYQKRFNENADYSNPPSDYLVFNTSINYEFPLKENFLQIGFVVDNLLNKSYRNYMNRFRYYTHEMGRNISFKINYQFN